MAHAEDEIGLADSEGNEGSETEVSQEHDARNASYHAKLQKEAKRLHEKAHEADERLQELQRSIRETLAERELALTIEKALKNRIQHVGAGPIPDAVPLQVRRKPHQPLAPQLAGAMVKDIMEQGMTWKEAERAYNVAKATVARYVKRERQVLSGEAAAAAPAKKRSRKLVSPDACVWLAMELERDSTVGLKALRQGLFENFDIDVQEPAISQALKTLKLTWKTTMAIPVNWNSDLNLKRRAEFVSKIADYLIRQVEFIYIDVQGYDLHRQKTKGHAPSGQRAVVSIQPGGWRVSVIAAMSRSQGMFHTLTVRSIGKDKRGVNASDFDHFLHTLRVKLHGTRCVLIFDIAKILHAELLRPTIDDLREHHRIDVLYLPPLSPWISAIEYAFTALRTAVLDARFQDTTELELKLTEAAESITPAMASGYFKKAHSYWEHAKLGLPFTGRILDPRIGAESPNAAVAAPHAGGDMHAHPARA